MFSRQLHFKTNLTSLGNTIMAFVIDDWLLEITDSNEDENKVA